GDRGSAGDPGGVRALGAGASTGSSAHGGGAFTIRSLLSSGGHAVFLCSALRTACRLAADAVPAADLPIYGLLRRRHFGAAVCACAPTGGAGGAFSRALRRHVLRPVG